MNAFERKTKFCDVTKRDCDCNFDREHTLIQISVHVITKESFRPNRSKVANCGTQKSCSSAKWQHSVAPLYQLHVYPSYVHLAYKTYYSALYCALTMSSKTYECTRS